MKDNFPPEWEVQKLSNPMVTKLIKAGGTPRRGNPEYWTNGTIPFVKISDITNGSKFLTKTEEKITKKGSRKFKSLQIRLLSLYSLQILTWNICTIVF